MWRERLDAMISRFADGWRIKISSDQRARNSVSTSANLVFLSDALAAPTSSIPLMFGAMKSR
ncbi:hypothetical protein IAD21_00916 [Abditibacteriota bacterium]|nr:hypothetical protein IAD21_00916 [Abditibacteriota bacterium]